MSKKPVLYKTLVVGFIICFMPLSPLTLAITKERINHPPEAPVIIRDSHPRDEPLSMGFSLTRYWNITTTDPDGDDIYLLICWGDGTYQNWTGLYHSDEKVSVNHTYSKMVPYCIKARAKDTFGAIGPWGTEGIPIKNSSFKVTITKPQNGIYCNNQKILPFFIPLILCGAISIVAEIVPNSSGMDRVEFYINDMPQHTVTGPGPAYVWTLTWSPFSKINVKVIAYTFNETASDEITIWRIFR